ncbi:WbqC family protein [Halocola ammonii]
MASKTIVLPICPFGNIDFYSSYFAADEVIFEQWEHYPKQTYRNRYEILGPNGRQRLTIPVVGQKGQKIPVCEIDIDYKDDWPTLHWRSIVTAYQRSPFFDFYKDEFYDVLFSRPEKLVDFNMSTHKLILNWLGKSREEKYTSDFFKGSSDEDLKDNFKSKQRWVENRSYLQVFSDRHAFEHNLSLLDLIFNLGPESLTYLEKESVD